MRPSATGTGWKRAFAAIALCIAGFFFVSYAIESGFFTPEMRVLSAAAASLLFLAGAEFVRRRVKTGNVEVTLKRLRRRGGSIALEPANKAYETRIFGPERVKVQGRLVGLLRRY